MNMPGMVSFEEMALLARRTNSSSGYSKHLKEFNPVNIELLVSLSDLDKTIKDFDDSDIKKGTVCQMVMYPGQINVGFFNNLGSGKGYYAVDGRHQFREGVHFRFV